MQAGHSWPWLALRAALVNGGQRPDRNSNRSPGDTRRGSASVRRSPGGAHAGDGPHPGGSARPHGVRGRHVAGPARCAMRAGPGSTLRKRELLLTRRATVDGRAAPSPMNAWPCRKCLARTGTRFQAAFALAGSPATMDSQDPAQAMQASAHRLIPASSPIAWQESAHCRQMRAQARQVSRCTGVRRSRLSALARQMSAHATSKVTCARSAYWPPIARQWLKVSRHVA
jgi:hypothetical protein